MAIICTNFLTGNDTTGTGSTGAPYKSIMKALAVAVSDDEIRVAGSQWTAITGTMTFTLNSTSVSTTTDLRAQIAVNDIITFTDSQFGAGKIFLRVTATAAASITISDQWSGPTQTTSGASKLASSGFHYVTTVANTTMESFNSNDTLPNGRTGIKVSGGWDSGYDSNSNGWTVFRTTQNTSQLFGAPSSPGLGDWKQNLQLDKFLLTSTGQPALFNNLAGCTGSNPPSLCFGEIALENGYLVGNTLSPLFYFSMWSPSGATGSKFYINRRLSFVPTNVINSAYYANFYGASGASSGYTPDKFVIEELWAACNGSNSAISATNFPTYAPFFSSGNYPFYEYKNYHLRGVPLNNVSGNPLAQNGTFRGYAENITYYTTTPGIFNFTAITSGSPNQIYGIGFTGAGASKSGITFGAQTFNFYDLYEFPNYTIESRNPVYAGTQGATAGVFEDTAMSRISQAPLASSQIKDIEGYKTMDMINNVYFKDEVNNWLRITGTRFSASTGVTGGLTAWKIAGVLEKPQTPFTVSFSLKVDSGTWNEIGVQYGPLASQVAYTSITPTSTFETYTISIDPATYSDWNNFVFPLYIGIKSNMPNLNYEEPAPVAYIQSLSIV